MHPREFFEYAEGISEALEADPPMPNAAAACRTAISRAYYAACLCTRDLLDSFGIDVKRISNPHANLQQAFQNTGVLTLQRIGNELSTLHKHRTEADYEMSASAPESPLTLERVIDASRALLQTVQIVRAGKFSPPIDPEAVVKAVLDWARANSKPIYRKPT